MGLGWGGVGVLKNKERGYGAIQAVPIRLMSGCGGSNGGGGCGGEVQRWEEAGRPPLRLAKADKPADSDSMTVRTGSREGRRLRHQHRIFNRCLPVAAGKVPWWLRKVKENREQ